MSTTEYAFAVILMLINFVVLYVFAKKFIKDVKQQSLMIWFLSIMVVLGILGVSAVVFIVK
jgi:hypothetical protein